MPTSLSINRKYAYLNVNRAPESIFTSMSMEYQKLCLLNVHRTPESMPTSMSMKHQKVCLPQCPWNTRKYVYISVHGTQENMPTSMSTEHQKVCPSQCPGNSSVIYAYHNVHKTRECVPASITQCPYNTRENVLTSMSRNYQRGSVYPTCRNHQKMSAHLDALVLMSESVYA